MTSALFVTSVILIAMSLIFEWIGLTRYANMRDTYKDIAEGLDGWKANATATLNGFEERLDEVEKQLALLRESSQKNISMFVGVENELAKVKGCFSDGGEFNCLKSFMGDCRTRLVECEVDIGKIRRWIDEGIDWSEGKI